jgi:putative transposase
MPTYTIRVTTRTPEWSTIVPPSMFMEEHPMPYNDLRKGRWSEPGREYLVTTVTARRRAVFADLAQARTFIRELALLETENRCAWLAWVLMPDHFHGLLRLHDDSGLSTVMRCLKARSARRIGIRRGIAGSIWQPGFHDRALRQEDQRIEIARYIIANPLRAGLAHRIGEYPHWDCVWI